MIGIENYKTGTKNNWRRMAWNRIAERINDRKNAVGLYLAAEQDLDRSIAVSKGFSPNNLIAVDIRKNVVEKLRSEGKLAIHGSMFNAISQFKSQIDFIHCDFCCGLTRDVAETAKAALFSGALKKGGVALFNMQRGREKNLYAESVKQQYAIIGAKSRAIFLQHLIIQYIYFLCGVDKMDTEEQETWCNLIHNMYDPVFTSYRSSRSKALFFDTLIINNPIDFGQNPSYFLKEMATKKAGLFVDIGRQISAVKAVKTMRNNGLLKSSPKW